jgi:hypothetical protein
VPPSVLSQNVGAPREAEWAAIGRTSLDKRPMAGTVPLDRFGLRGEVSDAQNDGGIDQAVYAFAREDLDAWGVELDRHGLVAEARERAEKYVAARAWAGLLPTSCASDLGYSASPIRLGRPAGVS